MATEDINIDSSNTSLQTTQSVQYRADLRQQAKVIRESEAELEEQSDFH